jgi:endonuclease YncB( thermonuclease family)
MKACGQDRNGRILGEVPLGFTPINLEMVNLGLAEVSRDRPAKAVVKVKGFR